MFGVAALGIMRLAFLAIGVGWRVADMSEKGSLRAAIGWALGLSVVLGWLIGVGPFWLLLWAGGEAGLPGLAMAAAVGPGFFSVLAWIWL